MEWALYSARRWTKLVTRPTTLVVELHNQVHIRNDLFNLLPQLDWRSTRCKLAKAPKSYGTLRNTTQPSSICRTEFTRFLPARQHGQDKKLPRKMSYLSLLFGPWGDNGESDLGCSEQVQPLWNGEERSYEHKPPGHKTTV